MKKWIIILSVALNFVTVLLMIDLGSFDSMENHLTNGGIVISRPIDYAIFTTSTLIIASAISIFLLLSTNKKE